MTGGQEAGAIDGEGGRSFVSCCCFDASDLVRRVRVHVDIGQVKDACGSSAGSAVAEQAH